MAPAPVRWLFNIARLAALVAICYAAVYIRLDAVFTYGRVIHEFDPWFNYRATEYLVKNGYDKFNTWFDDESWYVVPFPLFFRFFFFSLHAFAHRLQVPFGASRWFYHLSRDDAHCLCALSNI